MTWSPYVELYPTEHGVVAPVVDGHGPVVALAVVALARLPSRIVSTSCEECGSKSVNASPPPLKSPAMMGGYTRLPDTASTLETRFRVAAYVAELR